MKIALILFEISKIGGIYTVHRNVKLGLQRNGHIVEDFFVSLNKKRLPEKQPYCDNTVGFMTDELLNDFLNKLKEFDLVIFSHPCPTITQSFSSKRWMDIYRCGKPCITIVHDPFMDKYYPWFSEVSKYVSVFACIQYKSYDVIKKRYENVVITNHFMDLSDMGTYLEEKEDLVISPHQFKTWKNIDLFIRSIPYINTKCEVFNGGIEYHYMSGSLEKRKEKYKKDGEWIWEKAIDNGMNYRGFVSDNEIKDAYKRAKCSVDLSVGELGTVLSKKPNRSLFGEDPRPYRSLNYVPLETMKYGGIPIVREYSLLEDIITEDNVIVVDEDNIIISTAEKVNTIAESFDDYCDIIKRNFILLKEKYDCKTNAEKLLETL